MSPADTSLCPMERIGLRSFLTALTIYQWYEIQTHTLTVEEWRTSQQLNLACYPETAHLIHYFSCYSNCCHAKYDTTVSQLLILLYRPVTNYHSVVIPTSLPFLHSENEFFGYCTSISLTEKPKI